MQSEMSDFAPDQTSDVRRVPAPDELEETYVFDSGLFPLLYENITSS